MNERLDYCVDCGGEWEMDCTACGQSLCLDCFSGERGGLCEACDETATEGES